MSETFGGDRGSSRNRLGNVAERIAAEFAGGMTDEVARRLRVLGHPTRVALVIELAAGSRSVAALAVATGLDPAVASKHLRELQRASIVQRRQDGTHAIYALADATALKVLLLVARTARADAARITAALRAAS
jgi:DNA-binding transcriptional ArsR family regulator